MAAKTMPSEQFSVHVWSDNRYEELVAEITWGEEAVCVVRQEEGLDNLTVEIFPRLDGSSWNFELRRLEEAIEGAKSELYRLRRTD